MKTPRTQQGPMQAAGIALPAHPQQVGPGWPPGLPVPVFRMYTIAHCTVQHKKRRGADTGCFLKKDIWMPFILGQAWYTLPRSGYAAHTQVPPLRQEPTTPTPKKLTASSSPLRTAPIQGWLQGPALALAATPSLRGAERAAGAEAGGSEPPRGCQCHLQGEGPGAAYIHLDTLHAATPKQRLSGPAWAS